MLQVIFVVFRAIQLACRGHQAVALENVALRQQVAALKRSIKRPQLRARDRLFWILLSHGWREWRTAVVFVRPDTVLRWHRQWLRRRWIRRSKSAPPGRPTVGATIRALVAKMAAANPLWGAAHPRRAAYPRSHVNVTEHPTAVWTAQQLVDAFPDDTAPLWVLRDRDAIYGERFCQRVASMGIAEIVSAPSSPWHNPYVERLIGSLRRECLDHVIVLNAAHLRYVLAGYVTYYHRTRTHLALAKDAPHPRSRQPPDLGDVIAIDEVGGLHHRYERRAA